MAARTVLGPKPCSTQAPTVLDVDVLVPSVSMFPLGAGEPSRANPPRAADRPKAISGIGERPLTFVAA